MIIPSPAEVIRRLLAEHKLTQAQLAQALDVSLLSVNQLCNGHRSISPNMAIRLEIAFGPEIFNARQWLRLQMEYALYLEDQKPRPKATSLSRTKE